MNTKVYIFDATVLKNEKLFKKFYSLMPEYRKNKIDRLSQEKDKILCLGAGILEREVFLENGLGENPQIGYENGKPILLDFDNVFFNTSHSGEKVITTISNLNVGCDIEKIKSERKSISNRCYTKEEQDFVNKFEGRDRDISFFKIWTLKESFVKNLGAGLTIPFRSFSISLDDGISIKQNIVDEQFKFISLTTDDDYQIAICLSNCVETDKIEFNKFEIEGNL